MMAMNWRNAGEMSIEMGEAHSRYMVRLCLLCQSGEHALRRCQRIDFEHGSCCVSCGLPQMVFTEKIHGNMETGECEDGLKDMIKGGCWGIFRDEELKGKYLKNIFDGDEAEFKEWLVKMDESREMTNGVRLMVDVWRYMIEGG